MSAGSARKLKTNGRGNMRILVTGSRNWTSQEIISDAFDDAVGEFPDDNSPMIVIEGGAAGADMTSRNEAIGRGWHVARVNALWGIYGKSAGHLRNGAMVSLEPHVCLAFIKPCFKEDCPVKEPHDSHGVTDCLEKAKKAGIPVKEYR
jgi:hypothetical protein